MFVVSRTTKRSGCRCGGDTKDGAVACPYRRGISTLSEELVKIRPVQLELIQDIFLTLSERPESFWDEKVVRPVVPEPSPASTHRQRLERGGSYLLCRNRV